MLVDVLALRRQGAKLPTDALGSARRGWLRMDAANIAGEVTMHASLHAGRSFGAPAILPMLTCARVRKIDERGLLIFGLEADAYAGPTGQRWPQAWYCRPVVEVSPVAQGDVPSRDQ